MPPDPVKTRGGHSRSHAPKNDLPPENPLPTRIEALLGKFGPAIRSGQGLEVAQQNTGPIRLHPSGLPAIDGLLDGGFVRGHLSEIVGPPSSGRTSLWLSLLAQTTSGAGELAAIVDRADAFDPLSAQIAGVDLDRVLWVRVNEVQEALRSTERLLETEGLPLVLLDLDSPSRVTTQSRAPLIPQPAWTRLSRLALATKSALVILSRERQVNHAAQTVLELKPERSRFEGSPPLLTELESQAVVVRRRHKAHERPVQVLLGSRPSSSHRPRRP
ncbi:MAG: hypothetical protein VX252_13540 [Myxococcota bacterium]|nr:hypothetical protein [Myxococcota bacterium]